MFQNLLTGDVFSLVFVFARIGSAVMLLPGFGEVFIAARVRLLLAVGITVVVAPVVTPYMPPTPDGVFAMLTVLGHEIVIGLFLGAIARMMVAALHTTGVIIGFQTSLANAQLFDPLNAGQGSLIGSFLNVLGVFLIFATNLHHMMLIAVVDSYSLFVPGAALPLGDFSDVATRVLSQSFLLAMQLSAPFIVMGMLFYLGMGIIWCRFLIFATNLHHMMLIAVVDSYSLFVPGAALPLGDFSDVATRVLSQSFLLAMQLSAPFIVMGMLFYLGMGLLARLMPQVQIFFIAIPVQIFLGFLVMTVTLSAGMMWFLGAFQNTFQGILLPG